MRKLWVLFVLAATCLPGRMAFAAESKSTAEATESWSSDEDAQQAAEEEITKLYNEKYASKFEQLSREAENTHPAKTSDISRLQKSACDLSKAFSNDVKQNLVLKNVRQFIDSTSFYPPFVWNVKIGPLCTKLNYIATWNETAHTLGSLPVGLQELYAEFANKAIQEIEKKYSTEYEKLESVLSQASTKQQFAEVRRDIESTRRAFLATVDKDFSLGMAKTFRMGDFAEKIVPKFKKQFDDLTAKAETLEKKSAEPKSVAPQPIARTAEKARLEKEQESAARKEQLSRVPEAVSSPASASAPTAAELEKTKNTKLLKASIAEINEAKTTKSLVDVYQNYSRSLPSDQKKEFFHAYDNQFKKLHAAEAAAEAAARAAELEKAKMQLKEVLDSITSAREAYAEGLIVNDLDHLQNLQKAIEATLTELQARYAVAVSAVQKAGGSISDIDWQEKMHTLNEQYKDKIAQLSEAKKKEIVVEREKEKSRKTESSPASASVSTAASFDLFLRDAKSIDSYLVQLSKNAQKMPVHTGQFASSSYADDLTYTQAWIENLQKIIGSEKATREQKARANQLRAVFEERAEEQKRLSRAPRVKS